MTSLALLAVAELRWACGLMSHLQVTSSYESIQISPIYTGNGTAYILFQYQRTTDGNVTECE